MLGNIEPYLSFEILTNSTTYTVDLDDNISLYKLYTSGSVTMSNNFSVGVSGSSILEGSHFEIDYSGEIVVNGTNYVVTVLGIQISQEALLESCRIICDYTEGNWIVKVLKTEKISEYRTTQSISMSTSGTVTLLSGKDSNYIILSGSPTLVGNYTLTGTALSNGDRFEVFYKATPDTTSGTFVVSIFGYSLTQAESEAGNLYIVAVWNGSSWETSISNDVRAEGVISTKSLSDQNNDFLICIPISFDTDEQCEIWVPLLSSVVATSNKIHVYAVDYTVTKDIENSDDATLNLSWSTVGIGFPASGPDLTNFPITIIGGSTAGTAGSITVGDDSLTTYQYIVAEGTKTTPGGKVLLYLRCKKIPN